MRYRTFGRMGWKISEVGFGAWAIGGDAWGKTDDEVSVRTMHQALDKGINFIDTAQAYGDGHSERLIGKMLSERQSSDRIYVATKIPPLGKLWWVDRDFDDIEQFYTPEYLRERVEFSLRNLGVEALDLIQLHTWTVGFNKYDQWHETLERLREEGKLLAYGISASEQNPQDVAPLVEQGKLDGVQVIYNIFEQRTGESVLEPCGANDVGTIIRVPLDEGALTGKFKEDTRFPKGDFRRLYFGGNNIGVTVRRVEKIRQWKEDRLPDLSMVELALLFALSRKDASTVIVGMKNQQQLEANVKVGEMELLSENIIEEMKQFKWTRDPWSQKLED